jgi:hypothetical protein
MSESTQGPPIAEDHGLLAEVRNILRTIQMDRERLALISQKLVRSDEVIKRAQAAVIESTALMKQMGEGR